MQMQPVDSSNVAAIGFEVDSFSHHIPSRHGRLRVRFKSFSSKSGSTYEYTGVPQQVYTDLLASASKGKHFALHIRDVYPCEKIS